MTKNKKLSITLLKAIIVIATWTYVGFKISDFKDSFNAITSVQFSINMILGLILVMILMIVNWSIEAQKWRYSIRAITAISFTRAFRAILSGTTIGIISPNRAGEPFGRVSQLQAEHRETAVGAGIICSIAQFTATVLAGILALPFLLIQQNYFSNEYYVFAIAFLGIGIILFLYSNVNVVGSLFKYLPFIKKFESFINHFKETKRKTIVVILMYSSFRYIIFIVQFYVVLRVFSIDISFANTCIAVGMVYLITTIIPTTTLAELGVRCSSSVYFIGLYCNKPVLIVVASMALWIINISIPAIAGSILFLPWFTAKWENEQKK